MTKRKSTKRALLMSALSLLMCISMLIGSTFAWFTDEVTSSGNIIQSGTLDIALEKWDAVNSKWVDASNAPIFNYERWEPGYTEVANLRVVNLGTLALKWQATITTETELSILADVINVYVRSDDQNDTVKDYIANITDRSQFEALAAEGQFKKFTLREFVENITVMTNGTLIPEQESYLGIVLQMDTAAGNEYQGLDLGGKFDLKIMATQYTYEKDSFDDQYDAGADFPAIPGKFNITNAEELDEALVAGGVGTVLNSFADAFGKFDAEKEFVLDLNGQSVTGGTVATGDAEGGEAAFENKGKLTIKNGTINSDYITVDNKSGMMKLEDLTLNTSDILYGFYQRSGETILNNVDIVAVRGGMHISGGKVTINDGSMSIKGKSSKTGYFFYVYGETTEIVINGGDYTYGDGYKNYGVINATNGAKVIINGGRFEDGGKSYSSKWIQASNGATVSIYGGTFQFDPSAFVAEGYQAVKGADGWWTVSQIAG